MDDKNQDTSQQLRLKALKFIPYVRELKGHVKRRLNEGQHVQSKCLMSKLLGVGCYNSIILTEAVSKSAQERPIKTDG